MDKDVLLTLTLAFAVPPPAIAALQSPAVAAHTCLVSCEYLSGGPWRKRGDGDKGRSVIRLSLRCALMKCLGRGDFNHGFLGSGKTSNLSEASLLPFSGKSRVPCGFTARPAGCRPQMEENKLIKRFRSTRVPSPPPSASHPRIPAVLVLQSSVDRVISAAASESTRHSKITGRTKRSPCAHRFRR